MVQNLQEIVLVYISQFGYIGIFGSMMLGMIGLPVPDELLMTFAGYMVFKGQLTYLLTCLTASFGAISGVSFSFFVGHRFGLPLLMKYGSRVGFGPEKLDHVEKWFRRFGRFAVTVGYFIPGIRHFTAISAGISKWSYGTFMIYALPGGILWAFTFVTFGRMVGEHWRRFIESVHTYSMLFALGCGVAIIGWLFIRGKIRTKSREKAR